MSSVDLTAAWCPIIAEPGDDVAVSVTVPAGTGVGSWEASVWRDDRQTGTPTDATVSVDGDVVSVAWSGEQTDALVPVGARKFAGYWELTREAGGARRTWLKGPFVLDPAARRTGGGPALTVTITDGTVSVEGGQLTLADVAAAIAQTALDDLTDVSTSDAEDGDALVYDIGTGTWGPGEVSGGSMTGAEILAELAGVDGTGSGLDADTVDGQHAAAFEAAGAAVSAVAAHSADTTGVHGIADTTALATTDDVTSAVDAHASDTTLVHGIADTTALATGSDVSSAVSSHAATTTSVHGIADTTALATGSDVTSAVSAHASTTTNVHGIADTDALATTTDVTTAVSAHASDTTDVHGIADTTQLATATDLAGKVDVAGDTMTGPLVVAGEDQAVRLSADGTTPTVDAAGGDLILRVFPDADFTGTPLNYLRYRSDAQIAVIVGQIGFSTAVDGAFAHTMDASSGTAFLGSKNSLSNLQLTGWLGVAGPPAGGTWAAGDLVIDIAGRWWLCTGAGTPGTWISSIDDLLPHPPVRSGEYYYWASQGSSLTSNTHGSATPKATPRWFPRGHPAITRLGAEFTAAGDASSVLRLVLWEDDGGVPGDVLVDAGTISTGSGDAGTVATGGTPGAYEITLGSPVDVAGRWVWGGGIVQGVTTTQPTLRTCQGAAVDTPVSQGGTMPIGGFNSIGFSGSSQTGAATSFAVSGVSSNVVRLFYRTAA